MDSIERRRLLFEKATANGQRRRREAILKQLPCHLSQVLIECPCIYSVDMDRIIRQFFPFGREGVGMEKFLPSGFQHFGVCSLKKTLAMLPNLVVPDEVGQCFVLVESPKVLKFEGHDYLIPDSPLFVADIRRIVPCLSDLLEHCIDGLVVVEEMLRWGVLIDIFHEYLPNDPDPSRLACEVALWPVRSRA